MQTSTRNALSAIGVVTVTALALCALIVQTGVTGPIVLFALISFVVWPYRHEYQLVQRLFTFSCFIFALWFLGDLGVLLVPFGIAFFIAYLADPLVSALQRLRVPRLFSSLVFVLLIVAGIVATSLYVFPAVFSQMNEVIRRISSMVGSTTQYLESRQFYRWLESLGVSQSAARELVQKEIVPELESITQVIITTVLGALTSVSAIAAQAINLILIPVLTFYFLYDLPHLKKLILELTASRHPRFVRDIRRINDIVRAYIGGQIISALFVGIAASSLFLAFGIPYAIVLGVVCGLLNPIPYVGIIASLFIAVVTILIVNGDHTLMQIVQVTATVNVLHFVATYVIDPRVTGSRIGVHPVVLIASLFTFGHFFGFLGLVFSMPAGAVLMMYFNDWRQSIAASSSSVTEVVPASANESSTAK